MKKSSGFLTGLAAGLLSIGLVLTGCEGPAGPDGAAGGGGGTPGRAGPITQDLSAAQLQTILNAGWNPVYVVGNVEVTGGGTVTIPAGKTLSVLGGTLTLDDGTGIILNAVLGTLDLSEAATIGLVSGGSSTEPVVLLPAGYAYGGKVDPTNLVKVTAVTTTQGATGRIAVVNPSADLLVAAATYAVADSKTAYVVGSATISASGAMDLSDKYVTFMGTLNASGAGPLTLGGYTTVPELVVTDDLTLAGTLTSGIGSIRTAKAVTLTTGGSGLSVGDIDATGGKLTLATATGLAVSGELTGDVDLLASVVDVDIAGGTGNVSAAAPAFSTNADFGNTGTTTLTGATVTFTGIAFSTGGDLVTGASTTGVALTTTGNTVGGDLTLSNTAGTTISGGAYTLAVTGELASAGGLTVTNTGDLTADSVEVAGNASFDCALTVEGEAVFGGTLGRADKALSFGSLTLTAGKAVTLTGTATLTILEGGTIDVIDGDDAGTVLTVVDGDVVITPGSGATLTPGAESIALGAAAITSIATGKLEVAEGATLEIGQYAVGVTSGIILEDGAVLKISAGNSAVVTLGDITIKGATAAASLTAAKTVTLEPNAITGTESGAALTVTGDDAEIAVSAANGNTKTLTITGVNLDLTAKGILLVGHASGSTANKVLLKGGTLPGQVTFDSTQETSTTLTFLTTGNAGDNAAITGSGGYVLKAASGSSGAAAGSIAGGATASDNDLTLSGKGTGVDYSFKAGIKFETGGDSED
jgi:hypothetical protein